MTDPTSPGPAPVPEPEASTPAAPPTETGLADGEWHRLHPATPLLRGGIAFLAVLGVVIANLRERLIEIFVGQPGYSEDPLDYVIDRGFIGIALLIVAGVLLLFIAGFYLSWRFHTFRVTDDVVEVRSGVLFRTNRKARLDRIQGIDIDRPFIARLFGTAKLQIAQAGQDANVQLAYLGSRSADDLRREVLRLASGSQERVAQAAAPVEGGLIDRRVSELLEEYEPTDAPPESVVKMHPGRLIGSTILSETTIVFLVLFIGGIVLLVTTEELAIAFGFFPAALGLGGYLVNRITKSLRYSIAATPDGVRVGFGLLSTSNETLPPGRVHSVSISQSLLWRPAGWWEVKVNRASRSTASASQQQQRTVLLPVGNVDDVMRVLGLLLPGIDERMLREGLVSKGGDGDGFVNSPRRAAVLRWFSWRRNGFAITADSVVLRRGAVWRELVIVPQPRIQSVAVHRGPILRALDLATVFVHTVAGPITARLGAVEHARALEFFDDVARGAVAASSSDTTHRWRSGEAPA